jgi:hypothetical protein
MTSDPSLRPIDPLRARMIEDMTVRGFKEDTRRDYVGHVRAFAGRSPDAATPVRDGPGALGWRRGS